MALARRAEQVCDSLRAAQAGTELSTQVVLGAAENRCIVAVISALEAFCEAVQLPAEVLARIAQLRARAPLSIPSAASTGRDLAPLFAWIVAHERELRADAAAQEAEESAANFEDGAAKVEGASADESAERERKIRQQFAAWLAKRAPAEVEAVCRAHKLGPRRELLGSELGFHRAATVVEYAARSRMA